MDLKELNNEIYKCGNEIDNKNEMLKGCICRIFLTDSEVELKEMYIASMHYLQQMYDSKLKMLKYEAYKEGKEDF